MSVTGALVAWLRTLALGAFIRDHEWVIPSLQCVHIVCLAAVFASALMVNLRLIGIFAPNQSLADLADRLMPWIWCLLVILFMTGALLIIGEPRRALHSLAFGLKMLMLLTAGVITLFVHRRLHRDANFWELSSKRKSVAKLIGVASILLWVGVVFAGRWIAYDH